MDEEEWLKSRDPVPMLQWIRADTSDRKLPLFTTATARRPRLFTAACCRNRFGAGHPVLANGCEVAERWADGLETRQNVKKVRRTVWECRDRSGSLAVWHLLDGNPWSGALQALTELVPSPRSVQPRAWFEAFEEREAQTLLLRDIFGNPFRPVALDPAWLTSDVVALAKGIYDEKAFDRMPILADALQDAGCDNAEVLDHCRGENTHVRGCWVVDLLLGKS